MASYYEDDFLPPSITVASDETYEPSEDNDYNIEDEGEEVRAEENEYEIENDSSEDDSDQTEPIEYPSYLPEDLYVPTEFASTEERLAWFENAYDRMMLLPTEDVIKEMYMEDNGEKQSYTNEEIQELKALKEALDGNPEVIFKMRFGKDLIDRGHLPYISVDEGRDYIRQKLVDQFGDDYDLKYNPEEANKKGSYSSRVWELHGKLQEEIIAHNRGVDEMKASLPTREDTERKIAEAYETDFKDIMTRKEYDDFIAEMMQYKATVKDLYKVKMYDEHVEAARKEGIELGKKQLLEGLRRSGSTKKVEARPKIVNSKPLSATVATYPGRGIFNV